MTTDLRSGGDKDSGLKDQDQGSVPDSAKVGPARGLLRNLLVDGGSLSHRVARGSVWVFASYGLSQVLALARSIILARLLSPSDFGLMGLASLSTAFLLVVTETGIWPAVIQRQDVDQSVLDTAWLISVLRGLALGLLVFLGAPWIASFFESPLLSPILRVMAVSIVLSGFDSLGLVLLQKRLDFRTLAVFDLVTSVVEFLVAAVAAFLLQSVWALVIGSLAGSLAALVLSYALHPFRPRWRFDRRRAVELLNFGKFLTASSIVNYLLTQGDDAYVGKALGAGSLGFYEMAYRLSNLPATSISHVIGRVMLPAYSELQNDLHVLGQGYLRVLKLTSLASIPMAAGLFAVAPYLIYVLYGEKWMPVVPAFQILCLFGLERSIGSTSSPIFLALGKPNLGLQVSMAKLITLAVCIMPLTAAYGIAGTSAAATLSAIVVQCVVIPVVAGLLGMTWYQILQPLLKPCAGSLLMLGVLTYIQNVFILSMSLWTLLALTATGVFVYAAFIAIAERQLLQEMRARLTSWSIAIESEPVR